ncbi:outer membrane protein TolC [Wenyingzhuangia heitensis]|uniref:Outer membrane protein TolC n=1 Tax=Wenyingzhuangia heitensis TaxID=1487859 RepID=A0ABX0UGQ1_9FLAO|nr:TolC family protein [Wenyingzhuangia heitensis]NIJ46366.1 outer membrane protein TolC [Wenyingzhuangia heitensis]
MKNKILIVICFLSFGVSKAQSLSNLIEIGLRNNPLIQKFELQHQIQTEKVKEVNTLPNTDFSVGYFIREPETKTGTQRFKLSAKQMLPWFGTITARENYANSLADTKFEDIVIAKRKLITSVSQAYYNLYANQQKQRVFVLNINLLHTYKKLALTAVEIEKASVVDVLKLQMRINDIEQLKQVLEQQFLSEQTYINNLLNRDKSIKITPFDKLQIPQIEEELLLDNLSIHPELLKYDKLYSSVEQSELLNQKESHPLIGFGLEYINVERITGLNVVDNGKDVVMPLLSISIPIFNKKYRSTSKQNELKQKEIRLEKQERFNKLETLLDKATKGRQEARITYNIQTKNNDQAHKAEEILRKNYETGTIDFNAILEIQELQLKFQINQIEAIKKYYIQSSIINYLVK